MANVKFSDFSAEVQAELNEKSLQFLEEAANELASQTKRTTPTTEPQLKGSWEYEVNGGNLEAKVGSPLESSLWNEFGTGSYAEAGNGRKGWWVYIEGQGRSGSVSKTYDSEQEAQEAADFLRRVKKLNAIPSNGKPKQMTLRKAYASKKEAIIRRAEQIFKGE